MGLGSCQSGGATVLCPYVLEFGASRMVFAAPTLVKAYVDLGKQDHLKGLQRGFDSIGDSATPLCRLVPAGTGRVVSDWMGW